MLSSSPPKPARTPQVRLLGAPQWTGASKRTGPQPLSAKDAALLARLALDGPQARLALCELLWPGTEPQRSHASLRSRASRLYRAAAKNAFVEVADPVRLAAGVEVDLLQLDTLPVSALMVCGPLLAGVDLGDCDELDRWLTQARQRVADRVAALLEGHAAALERDGRLDDALALARRRVDVTPLSEAAWLGLMQLHYLNGDRAAAQDTFRRCSALLRDELGIRPGAPLCQLLQLVEAAAEPPMARHRSVPASVLRPPRLVGRGAAWRSMWEAWQQGQAFVVVGDAGQGKSRLLEDFCRDQEGLLLENAGADDHLGPLTLLARVLVAVDQRFAPRVSADQRSQLARVDRHFGRSPGAPGSAPLIERAVEALLCAAMECGLRALVVDDLHHADSASVVVLRHVSTRRTLAGLRLGFATRPDAPPPLPATLADWAVGSRRLVRVELAPLQAHELDELLASLMLPALVDRAVSERLFRHAGGHVLFTLATVQVLLLEGREPGATPLPLPTTVQALLDVRLAALPATCTHLLRVAAVAGPDLNAERAATMLECSVLDLAPAWAKLEAADVLRGEHFSHDLLHEAALRSVPDGLKPALHRSFAQVLQAEAAAHPARIATHWERGGQLEAAGRQWNAAAEAARRTGLIHERNDFLLAAAHCHARTGAGAARFDALLARVEGLQLRPGGGAVLDALPEVEALADTDERRLRCRLARVEALHGLQRMAEAAVEGRAALEAAHAFPALRADAQSLLAQALVHRGDTTEAMALARDAVEQARGHNDRWQLLRVQQGLSYVHFAAGELPAAIAEQQAAVELALALGHRFEAAAGQGHVAALLEVAGDVPGAHAQALVARREHRETGLDADGVLGCVNERVLGTAAAALGRYDEAVAALQAAVAAAGRQAAPAALAKAQQALAGLWIVLGRTDLARPLLQAQESDTDPARQVQWQLLLARAAAVDGLPAQPHLAAIGRIGDRLDDSVPMRSIAFEWSFQGPPRPVIARVQALRVRLQALGLAGTARALQWRELACWLQLRGSEATAAALALADELQPHVAIGLSAKCHPPAVWQTLAQARERVGDAARRDSCLQAARQWLHATLLYVPAEHRPAFVKASPLMVGNAEHPEESARPANS